MSWEATCWVMDRSKHKGANLFALLILGNSMNEEGEGAVAARALIQRRARIDRSTAARILRRLQRSGEFVCDARGTGHTVSHWHMPGVIQDGYAASLGGRKAHPNPLVPLLPPLEPVAGPPPPPPNTPAAMANPPFNQPQRAPRELKVWLRESDIHLDGIGADCLWSSCRARMPTCTVLEVEWACQHKLERSRGARNLAGLIIATVPDLLVEEAEALATYRRERNST